MIPRYMGPTLPDKTVPVEQGGGAWAAQAAVYGVGGARPKRPSLPGNLGTLEPEDQRLLELSEELDTQSETGAGFLSSRYTGVVFQFKF